ncbi:MAG: right-handed parallel beta-helix repeat-containing protein [Candidatus Thermoplasmatota archaeon]
MIKTRALFVCSLILVQIFIISPVDTVRPTTHAPIYIDGNANFASKALAEGWRGDGSIGKPYIIENYDINASTAHGIDIRNTNVYFIIRNCKIQGGKTNWDGIHFYNVANVEIQNVSSYDNRIGIRLDTVVNGNFQHVSSYNNSMGFYLSSSSSNKITSSQIYKNSDAIYIRYYSSNNKITSSQIYNNYNGISLGYSSNNEIHYNNIYNNTNYGVYNLNTEAQYTANATYNWLGSPDGPGDKGPGTGDNVSSNVIYDPWMKELLELLPPTVIQTSPYNGEIDVPIDKKILITFSEPMNISTIPGNITIEPGLEIKDYLWSKNNTTLTLLLSINLTSYTKYTVIINTNITDSSDAIDSNGVMHFIKNHLPEPYLFSFRTKDITPPIINIVSPSNCTITNQSVELIYTISDNADLLENLTIKGPANGTVYSDDGDYTITINVKDRANNTAEKIVKFIIDKTAPNITVLGVVDGGYYNISVIPIVSVNDKNLNTSSITLNNLPFKSGTSITEEGNYILAIRGVDKANNKAEKKVKFTIDKTAPNINITGAVDGYCNTSVIQ